MNPTPHPAAPHHLPPFLPGPDGGDWLLVVSGLFLLGAVLGIGLLFLRIHTLPERMAHHGQKLQFEIVAVLGLLALFTHEHLFWVIGLLLALIDIPDFTGPLRRIAGSTERIAGSAERVTGRLPDDGATPDAAPDAGVTPMAEGQASPPAEPAPKREH